MNNIIENFLTQQEEQAIIDAIRDAELNTSGEIRVHLENSSSDNAYNRAVEVFTILKMNNTKLQNAVLIYVAVQDKSFAVIGDKGIHDFVTETFWAQTKNVIENHFKSGDYALGLTNGILQIGIQLKQYFPWHLNDKNELPNNLSKS
jgi:uncharacterized membrane protein